MHTEETKTNGEKYLEKALLIEYKPENEMRELDENLNKSYNIFRQLEIDNRNMSVATVERKLNYKESQILSFNNYLDRIFKTSLTYLQNVLNQNELDSLVFSLRKKRLASAEECIKHFNREYCGLIKRKHQAEYKAVDKDLMKFINSKDSGLKMIWGDCLKVLRKMDSESIHLMVTSPPYYNAREYSQWDNINDYLLDMRNIIRETYRVLDNHRVWVFNIGDIFDNPRTKTKSVWGKTRLPLGAYFIRIFEECGFTFVDDIIWDKGEVQSERHKSGDKPYPLYQYPMNCYEHLLIFHKHRLDLTKYPCPVCGSLNVNGNTQSEPGLQSWECKNHSCFKRSASDRGKRFSLKTNIVQSKENQNVGNQIDIELIKKWRRDIVKFSPVIKINSKGENRLGHSAPFPKDIPEFAVKMYTYEGEKVLDPFAGSFTSVIAAKKLKRIGIGMELNKKLFRNISIKNIKNNFSMNLYNNGQINISEYDYSEKE